VARGALLRGTERLDLRLGFTVVFDDELVGGLDEELDELHERLAASEGITAVLHEDREVMRLRVGGLNVSEIEEKVSEAIERTGTDR
jgi:hypothetical protein